MWKKFRDHYLHSYNSLQHSKYNNHLILRNISKVFKECEFRYVDDIVVYIFLVDKKKNKKVKI